MSLLSEPGDLARTPLAAVLLEALNLRASGALEVAQGGGISRLWFREGRPVGAQVVAGFRPLGLMLLQEGLIDVDVLSRSLSLLASTGRPQGELLIEMGAVAREDVERALAVQQAGYFALIAALDAGAFRFVPGAVPEWTRGSRLSPLRTIVDALERPQAAALVESALQPVAAGGARLASGYRHAEAAFRWTGPERALLARLEPVTTLDAFLAAPGVAPGRARAILATLLLLGLAVSAAERPGETGDTAAGRVLDLEPEAVAQAAEAAQAVGPQPAPTPAPAAPGRRSDPAEARARRQRLLQQAMRNMGVGPFAGPRPPPAPPASRPVPPPGSRASAAPGSEADALRQAFVTVAPRAHERDLFTRLGVADSAGREDVKRAFLGLARRFHPDRFAAAGLEDLADEVRTFFTAVNEAYEILSDDRKRAAYLAARGAGGVSPARVESARVDFLKGEACARTRDLARARGFYESAVRADPRPEYQAALAFTFLVDPQRRDRERARALLDEATRDASCDRALYVAGILARDEGDDGQAERMFRAAAAANPRSAEAQRELRALEARRADRRRG